MGNTKHLASLLTSCLAVLSLATPSLAATKPKNAILLSEVQSLTLRGGAKTAHRRVAAAPQLKCISHPSICKLHDVDLMRCTNQGSGYSDEDIQWSCTANLPPTLKLGSTDVICEGYASSDDEYVLKGSCGVEYRLVLTDEGDKRYPHLPNGGGGGWGGKSKSKEGIDWSGILFMFCFVGVLMWMVYSGCTNARQARNNTTTRRPRSGGGGGGGGWGPGGGGGGFGGGDWGDDDPPPPYKPSSSSSSRAGWQPGFFTGAATGAAAGYYAGSRANRQQQQQQQRGYGSGSAGSSWFGGSGSPSSSNNDSGSSSSARYESTGFGSTSRR
ncbi:hypothetical protein PFICI_07498 [Pestalotiopsis fici W106-1]|uniref:Store-operated calcium entry-associated regulatory factor n=1 Tax=Pestalotiopsis fici (strain W106-1 / CGMCC3.15140) TaxID=1229662 RepID=W3X1S6_PESFW|nr:uncharacterized protein PFICI_07498 [Pestalotiopsis fici W106-1]ETS79969.1 hypothetical protein PFICI_07498 [Pestalotiopsis fici W106-1]